MALSPRQSKLVQGAAAVLVRDLNLSVEEAVALIGQALRAELESRKTTLDVLDVSSRAERASFVRAVVHRVQSALEARREWNSTHVRSAVEAFMEVLHSSWDAERSGG